MRTIFPNSGNSELIKEQNPSMYKIKVYAIVTLVLIVIGSGISYWTSGRIEYYSNALMHAENVMHRTDELYGNILERESNIRGYALTGNEQFLTNYRQSITNADFLLSHLRELTKDNKQQQQNIEELKGLLDSRVRSFEETTAYIAANGNLEGLLTDEVVSKALTAYQMIRAAVNKINEEENRLFLERNQSLINNINALPFIVGLISVFSISMGLVTFFSVYQYNKTQQVANKEISLFQTKLKDQIKLLDDSNKELEQFAYVASHDLQEPLRKITAFSDLLIEQFGTSLDEDGQLYLDRITVAANRMRRLITDLLEYSRAGREESEEAGPQDLGKIAESVLDDLEIAIKARESKITIEQLPVVMGRETEFRQIFQNLISNALKFAKPDITPEITISSKDASKDIIGQFPQIDQEQRYYMIQVADNGIGFKEEYAEKIFSIFQRLHGKNVFEGTGIGLSITKKIIDKNGGVIFASSKPDQGATFTILLPYIEE